MCSTTADVERFLKDFWRASSLKNIVLVPRDVNTEGLLALNLTKKAALGMLMDLDVKNYCGGPESDSDCPGQVWMFGVVHNGIEAYIKLRLDDYGPKCISFHPAKHALCYPHK